MCILHSRVRRQRKEKKAKDREWNEDMIDDMLNRKHFLGNRCLEDDSVFLVDSLEDVVSFFPMYIECSI